jgi:hypothetical protein
VVFNLSSPPVIAIVGVKFISILSFLLSSTSIGTVIAAASEWIRKVSPRGEFFAANLGLACPTESLEPHASR